MSLLTTHNVGMNLNDIMLRAAFTLIYNMLVIYSNFHTFEHLGIKHTVSSNSLT